jgi:D-sedoheptulose 7-phosphate isomerase
LRVAPFAVPRAITGHHMDFPNTYKAAFLRALNTLDLPKVEQAIEWFRQTRDAGRQIFVCGNGGSATTAGHFVCDMLKGASYGRPKRFRITSLADTMPTIMAYANDVNYASVFVEQLRNFAEEGDLLLAISGSGNSENVLLATDFANSVKCRTIGLTGGNGGRLGALAQLNIQVLEPHIGRVEDVHMIVCHMIAYHFTESGPRTSPALR